jgi:hypothetical protein
MPSTRQATLTLSGPEDQTVTFVADFEQLTLTRTQVGGYQSRPTGPTSTSFTPAAAEAFLKQVEALASKGLRDGPFDTLDAVVWKFTACDDKKTYEATGVMLTDMTTGDQEPDSGAELCALFELLKS